MLTKWRKRRVKTRYEGVRHFTLFPCYETTEEKMHALQLEWERFAAKKHENEPQFHTFRKRVPGGWLVFVKMGDSSGLTFCIDTEHQWTIETSERVEIEEE